MGMPQATFHGDQAGEFVEMFLQKHLQLEKRLNAVFGRGAAPLRECCRRGLDGGIDFRGVGQGHFAERRVVGGIDQILPFGGPRVNPLPGDKVGNADFGNGSGAHGLPQLSRRKDREFQLNANDGVKKR